MHFPGTTGKDGCLGVAAGLHGHWCGLPGTARFHLLGAPRFGAGLVLSEHASPAEKSDRVLEQCLRMGSSHL